MTSRARTWTRGSLKISAVLRALAKEAEGGPRKEAAWHNLRELASYNRLMIAGMMGDLTMEHQLIVRHTDESDPDPAELPQLMEKFIARVNLLFVKGEVLHMKHSFTAQMLKLFEKPSVVLVKRFAVLFAKPTGQDAKFEPLQRMRAIAGNVVACLRAALPDSVWQVQFPCFFSRARWAQHALGALPRRH